jgi:hypothetical protein
VLKYADDQGGYLGATITYYAFFAIFPLLLVLTTVLAFVVRGRRHLYQSIVNSALGQFPVIGPELRVHSPCSGSLAADGAAAKTEDGRPTPLPGDARRCGSSPPTGSAGARFWGQVRGFPGRFRVLQGKGATRR